MAKTYTVEGTTEKVPLDKGTFKAQGGEGAFHIFNGRGYKICNDGHMIPQDKFVELLALKHPQIVIPEHRLLYRNQPVGYDMMLVPNSPRMLSEILTKTFREREGVTHQLMADLVLQIRQVLPFIHSKGCLQVDGNENNYMVTGDYKTVYLIDTNAFQTPHYPCTVINPSVFDYHVARDAHGMPVWTELTDYWAFAIISWWMFTGIHPFKIRHAIDMNMKTSMKTCMQQHKSCMDAEAVFPEGAVYFPFEDYIPGGKDGVFMQWYRALFVEGKRVVPPMDYQAVLGAIITKVKEIIGSNNFDINEIHDFKSMIVGYYTKGSQEVVVTKEDIFINRQAFPRRVDRFRIGFTPNHRPYTASLEDGQLRLWNIRDQQDIPISTRGTDLMAYDGRIYVHSGRFINEIHFVEQGRICIATAQPVANVLEHATQVFRGVVVQQIFNTYHVSVFPEERHHRQVKIGELEGYRLTDAKFEKGVLMVIGCKLDTGEYDRFVIRFSKDWTKYDCRKIENITPVGINFTVMDSGIVVCITEEQAVEVFSKEMGSQSMKVIRDDKAVDADMHLCNRGGVQFAKGFKLFSFKMRK